MLSSDDVVHHTSSLGSMEHKGADAGACSFCHAGGLVGCELRDRLAAKGEKVKTYVMDAADAYYAKLTREDFQRLDAAGKIVRIEAGSRESMQPEWEIAATYCRHGFEIHAPSPHGPSYPVQACADCLAAVHEMFAKIDQNHPTFPPFVRNVTP